MALNIANDFKRLIFLINHPVGSLYFSNSNTNPNTFYGGNCGAWSKIEGKFILGASSTYPVDSTGGEATHKLTENEMPSHRHFGLLVTGLDTGLKNGSSSGLSINYANGSKGSDIYTNATGGDKAHNNMPPYIAKYIWVRTN